jgi:anti-sigma regulatory factor (Ser/Thr protein kinase)
MSAFTHELKTPMTAVIGYADTLRSMQCEPEQQQRAANYIFSEARRVEALSEKLLQLLGLREQAPALEPLELERVFARARAALGPSVAPVEPVFQPAPGVRVRGDADLLVDLLYNLVQNAARARPKDGRVSIGWHTAAEGQGVDVTVRDTGCGIPAAALARVTEPFYMVDKSRARAGGGSGMGLALCEKIAALHGGRLQIESVEGEGTAVTVRLPAAKKEERQCEQMEEMVRAPRGRGAVHGRFGAGPLGRARPDAVAGRRGAAGPAARAHAESGRAGAYGRGYVFNAGAEKIQPARKPERLPAGGNQPGFHVLCRAGRLALPCGGTGVGGRAAGGVGRLFYGSDRTVHVSERG